MKSLLFIAAVLFSAYSQAQTFEKAYKCEVRMFVEDTKLNIEQSLIVPFQSGSHGGEEHSYTAGDYTVTVMADAKWLGITWSLKDQIIAQSLYAQQNPSQEARALILYNPKNTEEQASLNCAVNQ